MSIVKKQYRRRVATACSVSLVAEACATKTRLSIRRRERGMNNHFFSSFAISQSFQFVHGSSTVLRAHHWAQCILRDGMPSSTEPPYPAGRPPLPQSRPIRRAQPPNSSTTVPESTVRAAKAEASAAESQLLTLVRKRKFKVRAIGITVLVAASAILGAQIKSVKQETDKARQLDASARQAVTGAGSPNEDAMSKVSPAAQDITQIQAGGGQDTVKPRTRSATGSPYSVDVARQITLLEDRKALLNREKTNIEAKIEVLRERRARKAEMEARRAGSGFDR